MADCCVTCQQPVRPKQHGVSCDICERWNHRTCNTGISQADYFKARQQKMQLSFTCTNCKDAIFTNVLLADVTDVDLSTRSDVDLPADITYDGIADVLSSTVADALDDTSNAEHVANFNLEVSASFFQNVSDHPESPSQTPSVMNVTYVIPAADVSDPVDAPFGVTRGVPSACGPVPEQSLGERQLSNTVIEPCTEITYRVLDGASEQGRKKLVSSDGYSYGVKKTTNTSVLWRCSRRRKGDICYATVTQRGDIFSAGVVAHTHPAHPLVEKKLTANRDIKRGGVNDIWANAGGLVDDMILDTFETSDFNVPRPSSVIRTLNRARQKMCPEEPKSLEFEVDTNHIGEDFLVGDVCVEQARHLTFATANQLRLLRETHTWYLDGTFHVVKEPFRQLWSVHAFLRQGTSMKQVPLLFVFMSQRRKQDYVAVLQEIVNILDGAPAVQNFKMDYEAALWQALRQVFPYAHLHGCSFHWAQAIQRHLQQLGLQETYEKREAVHYIVRKLLAIPFLPGCNIPRAFHHLKDRADGGCQPLRDLFEYVEHQWLKSSLWSTDEWSVYRQNIRTNNDTEGWHRKLNGKAGWGSLQFYVLLVLLHKEGRSVDYTFQLVSERSLTRHRQAVYVEMDGRINDLWEEYDKCSIKCEDFLAEIGEIYSSMLAK